MPHPPRWHQRLAAAIVYFAARTYVITHAGLVEEFTFVLRGKQEYELLCRRAQGGDQSTCQKLITSFKTG